MIFYINSKNNMLLCDLLYAILNTVVVQNDKLRKKRIILVMKFKQSISALLALLMLVSLVACGGEAKPAETPPDPLETAMENLNTVENLQAEAEMDMVMTVNGETVDTKTTMDMIYYIEPLRMLMEMSVNANGETVSLTMASEQVEDSIDVYYADDENWYYASLDLDDADTLQAYGYRPDELMGDYSYVPDGTEEVDGVTFYKYNCVLTGEAMQEAMNSSGALSSMADQGISAEDMEEMLESLSGVSIKASVWISEATMLPARYEMDMTELMNALMAQVIDSVAQSAGVSAADLGLEISVSKVVAKVRYFNYNIADDFEVPAEVVEYFKGNDEA